MLQRVKVSLIGLCLFIGCAGGISGCTKAADETAARDAKPESSSEPAAPARPLATLESTVSQVKQPESDALPQVGVAAGRSSDNAGSTPTFEMGAAGGERAELTGIAAADFAWDRLLAQVVTPEGLVRYDALDDLSHRRQLQEVIDAYAKSTLPASTPERLALWINAYNANAMLLAHRESRNPGFESVKTAAGFFDKTTITVAGEPLTLNQLRDDRIRAERDARVHGALVFGAMSCPPLRYEPYSTENMDEQLDEQCARWVNDRSKNTATIAHDAEAPGATALRVSEILREHEPDFQRPPFDGIRGFLERYARPTSVLGRVFAAPGESEAAIEFLPFEWSLDAAPTGGSAANPVK